MPHFWFRHIFCKLYSTVSSCDFLRSRGLRFHNRFYCLSYLFRVTCNLFFFLLSFFPFFTANISAKTSHTQRCGLFFHLFELFKGVWFKVRWSLTNIIRVLLFIRLKLFLVITYSRWFRSNLIILVLLTSSNLVIFCIASKLFCINILRRKLILYCGVECWWASLCIDLS